MLDATRAQTAAAERPDQGAEPRVGLAAPIRGRSLRQDAASRFMRNKAAVVSVGVLVLIVLFTLVVPFLASWSIEKIDWSVTGKVKTLGIPSIASGHYFGTDEEKHKHKTRCIQG